MKIDGKVWKMSDLRSREGMSPVRKCAVAEDAKENHARVAKIAAFVAVALCVPFLLWHVIIWLDASDWALTHIRSDGGIGIWFGFWGSYLGCVASVVIAFYTIRINRAACQRLAERTACGGDIGIVGGCAF